VGNNEDPSETSYRWVIVGGSFMTLGLSYVVMYSFPIFFVALLREFGWTRSTMGGAFSVFWIVHGFTSPLAGAMVDHFGPSRVFILGSLVIAAGLALCSLIESWWHLYFYFSVLGGIGVGATGWVPNMTVIQAWFQEKRGLATGIISAGVGIGIFVCMPSVQHLINRFGWRMAYRILAVLIPLSILAITIVFTRKGPQSSTSGTARTRTPPARRRSTIVNTEWTSTDWTLRHALRTRQFWILTLSFFFTNLINQSVMTHQVAFFVDGGVEILAASFIGGMIGIVSIGGKIFWATLSDRIGREAAYAFVMACAAAGIVCLIGFSSFKTTCFPYLFAFFFGMGYAGMIAIPPLITADLFEGQSYGSIFGSLFLTGGFGGAFGAWFAGFLHDRLGSYVVFFILIIACEIMAYVIVWKVAPRKIRSVPGRSLSRSRGGSLEETS
jgi:MFS family permease